MKNRLQRVFSHEEPTDFQGTIKFVDNDSYKEFLQKLKILQNEGTSQKLNGVERISIDQNIGGINYPYNEHDSIKNTYIMPTFESIEISVNIPSGEYIWKFDKEVLQNGIRFESKNEDIVHIRHEIDLENKRSKFTYKIRLQEAKYIREIIECIDATIALMDYFFKEKREETEESIRELQRTVIFWKRVVQLEEILEVTFKPQEITNNSNEEMALEELFLALNEGYIIKENKAFDNIRFDISKTENIEDFKRGMRFTLNFLASWQKRLLGVDVVIYTVNAVFNAIVDSIEEDNLKNEYVVKIKDTDTSPMYMAYKTVATEKLQEEELEKLLSNYNENIKMYSEAKTFEQLYKEIYDFSN